MTDKERRTLENLVLDEDVRTAILSNVCRARVKSATVKRLIDYFSDQLNNIRQTYDAVGFGALTRMTDRN